MFQDVRFAFRLIRRDRWFAAVAVLVLALGIGINAMVFTLVNAVLLRGLPFPEADNLYVLGWRTTTRPEPAPMSYPDLQDLRSQARTLDGVAAFANQTFNISDDRALPEQARGARLTANAFGVLRQQTLLGRDFSTQDEDRGGELVVMLGHTLWTNRYAADRNLLGQTIRLNGEPATVVGVMPPGMQFPSNAELWVPIRPTAAQTQQRNARFLTVFGRLASGASPDQAGTELSGIAGRMKAEYPDAYKESRAIALDTMVDRFNTGPVRVVFLSMMGAVGFVLLIACANVANLQLTRALRRSREISVRLAMGASRWRIVRQLLIESVLIGLMGGAIGLGLAVIGIRVFDAAVADTGKPFWMVFSIDYIVFAYLAGICVLTGILFGLAPALQVSKTNVNDILKEGGRGNTGGRRARWASGALVVVELALTIVLLAGAGLMIRSFLKLYSSDLGIRTANVMSMRLQLASEKYNSPDARRQFLDALESKIESIPGAEEVAMTTSVPPFGAPARPFEIEGALRDPDAAAPTVATVSVSPRFLEVFGVSILRGRGFHELDGTPGAESALINERMAAQYFGGEDPVGRRFRFVSNDAAPGAAAEPWRTIVGVTPALRHSSPSDAEPRAAVYLPLRQELDRSVMLLVRSSLDPGVIMNAVRRDVQTLDRDQPVFSVQTVDEMLANARWPYRVFGSLFAFFAFIGLVLSSVGLYAVMAYSVSERTSEIGIRMALGAAGSQVSWLFLRRGLLQLALGLVLGLAGAFLVSGSLRSILVQTTPTDPATFAAITALLAIVGVAACVIPARRATRVDPLTALRTE